MQQIPVGWTNPQTRLVIGAGALVHPDILMREVKMVEEVMPGTRHRLYIDIRAGLHTEEHTERSAKSGRHYSMGATGKGCSEALMDRIRNRGTGGLLFKDHPVARQFTQHDTVTMLHEAYDNGEQILLEGTQGHGLDLYLGPYPYTTHKQSTASQWVTEAGLSPSMEYEVVLVARTFPIRVSGNSGPMNLEISWPSLARRINKQLAMFDKPPLVDPAHLAEFESCLVMAYHDHHYYEVPPGDIYDPAYWSPHNRDRYRKAASELHRTALSQLSPEALQGLSGFFEMTTVTKKLRRIALLDIGQLKEACRINRPKSIIITFANYAWPELWGATSLEDWRKLRGGERTMKNIHAYLRELEVETETPVSHLTFGPADENVVEVNVKGWLDRPEFEEGA